MRRLSTVVALSACALAGLALAACASKAAGTVTTTSTSTTTTTTTSTVPPTSTSPSTSSTTSTTSAAAACQGSQLSVARNNFSGAAGELSVGFAVVNKSTSPCSISGYPTVLLEGSGTPVAVTSHSGRGPAFAVPSKALVLAAGGKAGFVWEFSDVESNGSQCSSASSISVILPASGATATTISYRAFPCGGPGSVSPIESSDQEQAQFS